MNATATITTIMQLIDNDKDKKMYYDDWLEERRKIKQDAERAETHRLQIALRAHLEDQLSWVKIDTTWDKAQEYLKEEPCYARLGQVARLKVWEDFMDDIEKKEKEMRQIAKEERIKKERENREAFKVFLEGEREKRNIHAKMRWKDFYARIAAEPILLAVQGNTHGSRPKELFMDVIEGLERAYYKERDVLQSIAKKYSDALSNTVSNAAVQEYDEYKAYFRSVLTSHMNDNTDSDEDVLLLQQALGISDSSLRLFFEEKKGIAERQKREDFLLMMEKKVETLSPDTAYEEVEQACKGEETWMGIVGGEKERRQMFDACMRMRTAADKVKRRGDRKRERGSMSPESHEHGRHHDEHVGKRSRSLVDARKQKDRLDTANEGVEEGEVCM